MLRVELSKRGKWITSVGFVLMLVNFAMMIGLALKNGTVAFPGGKQDEAGYYVINHGKRYDFSESEFRLSYYQGMATMIIFPAFFVVLLVLFATGDARVPPVQRKG